MLQQDGGDSDIRGGDEAVHLRSAQMACVTRTVIRAIIMQCRVHMLCVKIACSVWTCGVTFFGCMLSTSHSVGLWAQGCKAYLLQQDGGDSDVRGGDETVHSRGAYIACVSQAVTRAIAMLCCIDMCHVQVMCSPWTCEVTSVQWHLFPICSS